jgi:hypothetical protein
VQNVLLITTIILFVWTAFLSWKIQRGLELFNKLGRVKKGTLSDVLSTLLKNQTASKEEFDELYREIARIDKEKSYFVQKMGFVRFTPFGKEEMEQSFTLALLDSFGNGVVVTSINSRDFTRMYAKEITRGKSKSELSVEEQKAIQVALKI